MKLPIAIPLIALAVAATQADASPRLSAPAYPGCDLRAQHTIAGSSASRDKAHAHIALRADTLQADIGNARKARLLTQGQANALWQRVARIRHDADGFARKQGFLSAGERASYDRALDQVALRLCR